MSSGFCRGGGGTGTGFCRGGRGVDRCHGSGQRGIEVDLERIAVDFHWLEGWRRLRRRWRLRHLIEAPFVEIERVGGQERAFPAQPLRDDGVRVAFPQHDERAAEPLEIRPVPRLARHEVLADDAGLEAAPDFQIGVGQLRLRLVHRRFELAVDADVDQPHQRDRRGSGRA